MAIEFYASGLPQSQAGNYTWWHDPAGNKNKSELTTGNFQKDKRRLVIANVQESNSGDYIFKVLYRFGGALITLAFASTRLVVAGKFPNTDSMR